MDHGEHSNDNKTMADLPHPHPQLCYLKQICKPVLENELAIAVGFEAQLS